MKRQRKSKKIKLPSLGGPLREAVMSRLIGITVILIFLAGAYAAGRSFLQRSGYFRLHSVEVRDTALNQENLSSVKSQLLYLYGGTNIFSINLKSIAQSIERTYPDVKDIVVRIALPDKLVVTMKVRKPVAAVMQASKLYPVDEDAYVVPRVDSAALADLPVIRGVAIRYGERNGKKIMSGNLKLAINLLKEARRARLVMRYGIESIDASDPGRISFTLRNGVQIRIGAEDFAGRLQILEKTMKDPRLVMDSIEYIDVTSEEVAIGPK